MEGMVKNLKKKEPVMKERRHIREVKERKKKYKSRENKKIRKIYQ